MMKNQYGKSVIVLFLLLFQAGIVFAANSDSPAGSASKEELVKLYQQYFAAGDTGKLASLVYWPTVQSAERDLFMKAIRDDLKYRIKNVKIIPLEKGEALEYTRDGIRYVPTLDPLGQLQITFAPPNETAVTAFLVGMKGGRYFITLASPAKK